MNISLTPELEQLVSQKVSSELYASPLEVIRDALCVLDQQDAGQQAWLNEMREQIAAGLAQLKRGEGIPGEQVFDELRRKSQQRRRESAQP
jgi:antitoxin ParD1/3/4